jgi:hypothetical protein
METSKSTKSRQLIALLKGGLAVAAVVAVILVPATRARAQANNGDLRSDEFIVYGFQEDSSAPFLVTTTLGDGVWQHLVGPVLGPTYTLIPSVPGFAGAGCQAEYSQDQIRFQDGSTIKVNVFGTRCESSDSPGAHKTFGIYSLVSGTGRFANAPQLGTGPVTIDARTDGSTTLVILGCVRSCTRPM